jgi:uncharacterized protein HemX
MHAQDPFDWINQVLFTSITAAVSGFTGWFFGRKRSNAEVEGLQIANSEAVRVKWQQLSEKFEARCEQLEIKLDRQHEECERDTAQLKTTIQTLQRQVNELSKNQHSHDL